MAAQRKESIYQLKVTLRHVRPPVWRRIQVRGDATLDKLHQTLQIAMGWTESHMHQFVADGVFYGQPDPDLDFNVASERRTRLCDVVSDVRDRFIYEYDFGDGWEHELLVEEILQPEPRTSYPRCIKGKRNCPPEDVGGPWGYANFLQALHDENHPMHAEYQDSVDDSFDPDEFDLEAVNDYLKTIR